MKYILQGLQHTFWALPTTLSCFCRILSRGEKTIYELFKTQKNDSEIQHAQDAFPQWG